MRLIDTATLEIWEVPRGRRPPPYAILTHRWSENGEITFRQIAQHPERISSLPGFAKLRGFCDQVRRLDLRYAWMDTCCIDKDSTSELTDALASMYRWYAEAEKCIAYLWDVPPNTDRQVSRIEYLRRSEWFERGWTLQELLAPRQIFFYDRAWFRLGTKSQLSFLISEITGIPERFIDGSSSPQSASVAQIFSWSARRKLTVPCDRAHCLVGLLNLNIVHLGESEPAEKAFERLQIEALNLEDQSLFAWTSTEGEDASMPFGLFARSPDNFLACGNIIRLSNTYGNTYINHQHGGYLVFESPYLLPACKCVGRWEEYDLKRCTRCSENRLVLQCSREEQPNIPIQVTVRRSSKNIWYRIRCDTLETHEFTHSDLFFDCVTQRNLRCKLALSYPEQHSLSIELQEEKRDIRQQMKDDERYARKKEKIAREKEKTAREKERKVHVMDMAMAVAILVGGLVGSKVARNSSS